MFLVHICGELHMDFAQIYTWQLLNTNFHE